LHACGEMQVGGIVLDGECKQLCNINSGHGFLFAGLP
jgi:hypothetical protein